MKIMEPVANAAKATAATVMFIGMAIPLTLSKRFQCRVIHGETCRCQSRN